MKRTAENAKSALIDFPFESSLLIKDHLLKWSEMKEGLSIRAWAKLMNMSSTYLNLIINSKRLISHKALIKAAKALDLDALSQQNLKNARDRDWLKIKNVNHIKFDKTSISIPSSRNAKEILSSSLLLKSWIPMALLDFTTCIGFTEDLNELARIFDLPKEIIQKLLNELEAEGLLIRDENNRLKKKYQDIRVPTPRSSQTIRAFHLAMMRKAMDTLSKPATSEDVSKRLINSYTVAINEEQFPQAIERINSAFQSIVDDLKVGACTTVYQVQLQIIPLLKKK